MKPQPFSKRRPVYLTGSGGRGEAGRNSDLDLFILGREERGQRMLSRLDEIIVKADLIEESRRLDFPEFSGDGKYLVHYTVGQLCNKLGDQQDDAENTFTARLLLLLESDVLLGKEVYESAINDVIAAYWLDYEKHRQAFVPAFLGNDIVRLWKTFCVNYEARSRKKPDKDDDNELIDRKILNYKLKHSRMLTCYSGLVYLLWVSKKHSTVTPANAREMVSLTPTQRLEWLRGQDDSLGALINPLLADYETFLAVTDAEKATLREKFSNRDLAKERNQQAKIFGERMFALVQAAGKDSPLYRFLVV